MKIFRFIIPVIIIGLCGWQAKRWIDTKPEARRFETPPATTFVDATAVQPRNYRVVIESQGTVKARTESTLIPEVAGIVVKISPNFRAGGFFEAGELLLQIDQSDYETGLTVAQAAYTDAASNLEQEKALAEQALADWKRLGRSEEASALTLRKPQLARAEAAVKSAEARVKDAKRNLQRTKIAAPYAGRILNQSVDIGQYVSPGTVLANVYAVDYAEIRLPLSNDQQAFLKVPERYRGDSAPAPTDGPAAKLFAEVGARRAEWQGKIVRAEGAVDINSRQQFVIAQVDDPYARRGEGQPPLKVGMYVEAEIQGSELEGVFVIPRSALRPNDEVLIVGDENRLHRRQVEIQWRDEENVVVADGIEPGTVLCLTSLPFAAENALVVPNIDGEGPRYMEGQKPQRRGPPGGKKGAGGPAAGKKGGDDWKSKNTDGPPKSKAGQPGAKKKGGKKAKGKKGGS